MSSIDQCKDVCNSLLRGEISAVETYLQAIEKFEGDTGSERLKLICDEHKESALLLKKNVELMGGEASKESGSWGFVANSAMKAATLLGEDSAIAMLIQGEEHGKKDYESALENEDVLPDCKELIRNTLLPRQVRHIETLKALNS